jgi:hypothetical protein
MTETHSSIDRLETRVDRLTARVDALYSLLETREILSQPTEAGGGDALFDELVQIEDTPFARETRTRSPRRQRATRLHVGSASGV